MVGVVLLSCMHNDQVACCCLFPPKVTTVKFRYWLNALYQFSLSQSLVSSSSTPKGEGSSASPSDLLPSLSKASAIVYNAMMLMKVKLRRCSNILSL